MEKREYINKLKEYTMTNGISIYDYYWYCAKYIRERGNFKIPEFELQNPFITTREVQFLLNNNDSRIEEYYASAMTKIISLQQASLSNEEYSNQYHSVTREEIQEIVNEKLRSITPNRDKKLTRDDMKDVINEKLGVVSSVKGKLTSIGRKLSDLLNGFAVVREDKTARTHLYYHDAKKNTLKGEQLYYHNRLSVQSGYYVNYQEYLDRLIDHLIEKHPTASSFQFIRDDGVVKSLKEVVEEAYAILTKNGVIRYGKPLVGKEFHSYEEYKKLNIQGVEYYAEEPLKVGIYVRRDILTRIFARYKAKAIIVEQQDEKKSVK
ncbi:MAG: hypothetical protein IKF71_03755 [Bacilli bacterium]|nr:hypothetical protein [Bacilli bacterium]